MPGPARWVSSALREVAVAGADLARYCDYVEHAETADAGILQSVAARLRCTAAELAQAVGADLINLYADRLDAVERRFVAGIVDGFEAGSHVRLAETWRDLQLIQAHHDRLYRADVNGLARVDQVRHVCIHVAKLVGALASLGNSDPDLSIRVIPDLCVLGVKLSTVCGEVLPAHSLPRTGSPETTRSLN